MWIIKNVVNYFNNLKCCKLFWDLIFDQAWNWVSHFDFLYKLQTKSIILVYKCCLYLNRWLNPPFRFTNFVFTNWNLISHFDSQKLFLQMANGIHHYNLTMLSKQIANWIHHFDSQMLSFQIANGIHHFNFKMLFLQIANHIDSQILSITN